MIPAPPTTETSAIWLNMSAATVAAELQHALQLPTVERLKLALEYVRQAGPHCRQILIPGTSRHLSDEDLVFLAQDTVPFRFDSASRRLPYVERPDSERSPLHWGQLKLFVSELYFLTQQRYQYERATATVVYAGAAPGGHIPLLASLFPTYRFVLYDPSEFCVALRPGRAPTNVEARRAYFDDGEVARVVRECRGGPLLFISDIRTGLEEKYVESDMQRQRAWIEAMRPAASMVKFRLPWQPGKTSYFAGELLIGVFPPLTSTESRLIVRQDAPVVEYDNTEYEQQCAYHNTVGRVRAYDHKVSVPGLDHCHDCTALVVVTTAWLRKSQGRNPTPAEVGEFITAACSSFGSGRNLETEYARSTTRS